MYTVKQTMYIYIIYSKIPAVVAAGILPYKYNKKHIYTMKFCGCQNTYKLCIRDV